MEKEINNGDLIEIKKKFDKRRIFSFLLKASKIVVVVALLYTSFIMYHLGNPLASLMIIFGVAFFLILNKLESTWG